MVFLTKVIPRHFTNGFNGNFVSFKRSAFVTTKSEVYLVGGFFFIDLNFLIFGLCFAILFEIRQYHLRKLLMEYC